MKRVVVPWLPMEDPGNEARRIVRRGMADIIGQLDDERLTEVLTQGPGVVWGDPYGASNRPTVDMVVGASLTFVSAEVDASMTAMENQIAALQAQFQFDMQVIAQYGSFRRRFITGLPNPA